MLFQNRPTLAFGWTPTYILFYFWKKKNRAFLGVLHTKRGSRVVELPQNDQKWTKMRYFGKFSKNRPTAANNGSKIVSRVLFWYPGICATQKQLRSSISARNNDLVSFLKPKIVDLGVFWGKFQRSEKEAFLLENAILALKKHDFFFKSKKIYM